MVVDDVLATKCFVYMKICSVYQPVENRLLNTDKCNITVIVEINKIKIKARLFANK